MLIVNRDFDFYDCLDSAMALGNPPMLCGKGSKDIKAEMEAGLPCNNKERLVKLCSKFFSVRNKISTDAFDGSFLCYRLYIHCMYELLFRFTCISKIYAVSFDKCLNKIALLSRYMCFYR